MQLGIISYYLPYFNIIDDMSADAIGYYFILYSIANL